MKLISIIIPTNKVSSIWKPLLVCIAQQTYASLEVILCIDRMIDGREFDQISKEVHHILDTTWVQVRLITPHNTTFIAAKGASYVRNYGADSASGDMVLYMDDDGIVDQYFVQNIMDRYDQVYKLVWHDIVLSPTIMYRDTGHIQSQWFDRIWRGLWRAEPHVARDYKSRLWKRCTQLFVRQYSDQHIKWLSCVTVHIKSSVMWLFAPRAVFQIIRFDEQFEFVYEDLDFCYRADAAWFAMIVTTDIVVNHMEAPRTLAQVSYLGSPQMVYYKARNRILFVRRNAPWRGQLVYYCCAMHLQTIWFVWLIIFSWTRRWTSLWMFIRGTYEGIMTDLSK